MAFKLLQKVFLEINACFDIKLAPELIKMYPMELYQICTVKCVEKVRISYYNNNL